MMLWMSLGIMDGCTVSANVTHSCPYYPQGTHSKSPKGYLKLRVVLNPTHTGTVSPLRVRAYE